MRAQWLDIAAVLLWSVHGYFITQEGQTYMLYYVQGRPLVGRYCVCWFALANMCSVELLKCMLQRVPAFVCGHPVVMP